MKNVLYIGNNLKRSKTNISSISTLSACLRQEGFWVKTASSQPNKLIRLMEMLWACFKWRKAVDVVLIDTYSTQNFYYALMVSQWCRLLKLPYIPILHGGNLPIRLEKSPKCSKMLFKHSHQNVSPSLYLKNKFETKGFKVNYIPNTIALKNYTCIQRQHAPVRLFWLRSFSKIYNPLLAVKVLKILQSKGYDVELCMVGPDSDGSLSDVKAYCHQNKLEVTFTGKLSKLDWIKLSKNYNVFINTTNFDNMPVSVIEAMALGLPIVSTHVGGMPHLIDDRVDGLLVPPKDENAMCDAIIRLYEDKDLSASLALNARQKAETFDWEVVKRQWFNLLN